MARIWWAIACCAFLSVSMAVALPAAATSTQEQVAGKDTYNVAEGITVVKTAPEVANEGSPRAATDDDKEDIETMVIDRIERYLKTHTLKVDLSGNEVLNAVSNAGRSFSDALGLTEDDGTEEGRGKKKKAQKVLLPLLLALKLKAAAILPLALGAIALIAGKALLIGKIALLLAGIIGLKKLLHTQKSVTYEIVSHPHHASSHHESHGHEAYSAIGGGDIGGGGSYSSSGSGGGGGGHGGWGRSQDAQQLAYNSYQPVKQ